MQQGHVTDSQADQTLRGEVGSSTVPYKDLFNSCEHDVFARLQLLYSNAKGGYVVSTLCMIILCFGFDTPDTQEAKK